MRFLILIIQMMLSLVPAAAALATDTPPAGSSAAAPLVTHDYTLSLTANSIRHKIEKEAPVVIVDVRNRSDYEKIHITSAINLPLYAVKTKPFFKRSTLVLTNNGFNYGLLEKEAGRLKELGFDVSILRGGINAWLEADFPLTGDVFSQKDVWLVEPKDACLEQRYNSYLAVNAEPEKKSGSMFSNVMDLEPTDPAVIGKLKKYNQNHPANNVLVFNETGESYAPIREQLLEAGVRHVFCLKGGLEGYATYLHNLELSRAPREKRIVSTEKCKRCRDL